MIPFMDRSSRASGEIAIPSGLFYNGDGTFGAGETEEQVADTSVSTHIFPDVNGGVWKANRDSGSSSIRYFPMQGFDASGNPQYTFASSTFYSTPGIYDIKRVEYDAANDVLFAMGRNATSVTDSWWAGGDRLVRYDNFRKGRSTAWSIDLAYTSAGSPASDTNVKAFCEAGDYLFLIAAREGRIYVHKKTDGSKVGEINPFSSTGNKSGWSDINGAIRATKRSNGEYLIFAEENGCGKIMMYRWNPTAVAPTGINLLTNSSFDAEASDTQTPSGWTEWSSNGGAGKGYTESNGGSNSGARHGTHCGDFGYNMYTSQTKNDLPNGLYTLRAYARRNGNQTVCQLEATDSGGITRTAPIPASSTYQLVEIKDINVTNGKCTVGIRSEAAAYEFVHFDDVSFTKQ